MLIGRRDGGSVTRQLYIRLTAVLYGHSMSERTQNSRYIKLTPNLNKHSTVFISVVLKSGVTNTNLSPHIRLYLSPLPFASFPIFSLRCEADISVQGIKIGRLRTACMKRASIWCIILRGKNGPNMKLTVCSSWFRIKIKDAWNNVSNETNLMMARACRSM